MKHLYILSFLLLLGILSGQAQSGTVTVNGTKRSYIAYVPKNLDENRPLLISCHGMNQDAAYQRNMLQIERVADTAKFVTVFPEGIDRSWDISGDRDINFMKALIDEMVSKYQIDRNRVYLSGFSMGGMFTYHAMNKIPDLIAAFAPISGYPMGGATANSNVRPLPIIHTHGTADDVVSFSGVQGALNVWIKHNGCPTTPKVTKRYRGANHITRRVWGPGNDGVEVVLMEMADKGHWISNDNGVYTGDEIWRFCKQYSLNKTSPTVILTSPKAGIVNYCFSPKEEAVFPDVTLTATASDPNGTIALVELYDGSELVASFTEPPYSVSLSALKPGKHTFQAVATDNDGETGSSIVEMTCSAPQAALALSQAFNENGCVPAGWTTYDSSEKRIGYSGGYSQGCRILQMTGSQHSFSYGLYFRNIKGSHHSGYAKYGLPESSSTLRFTPGHYELRYKICNWNRPQFSPVTISIERADDATAVASTEFTPTVNIGNAASNNFTGVDQQTFEFDITESGYYALAFYTADAEWADAIIGSLVIEAKDYGASAISSLSDDTPSDQGQQVYDLQGRLVENGHVASRQSGKGIYIIRSNDRSAKKFVHVR
jgi:poly(hydroxyalkanoate) depolymerase family esterase